MADLVTCCSGSSTHTETVSQHIPGFEHGLLLAPKEMSSKNGEASSFTYRTTMEKNVIGRLLLSEKISVEAKSNSLESLKIPDMSNEDMKTYRAKIKGCLFEAAATSCIKTGASLCSLRNEVEVLAELDHQNIVKEMGWAASRKHNWSIVEFVAGYSLNKMIEICPEPLSLFVTRRLFGQLCSTVLYLHREGYYHGDLWTSNVYVDGSGNIKLADFRLAKTCNEAFEEYKENKRCTPTGHVISFAPELFDTCGALGPPIHRGSDIWSLGVILHYMVSKHGPFRCDVRKGGSNSDLYRLLVHRICKEEIRALPSDVPNDVLNLVHIMLTHQASERARWWNIISHQFFQDFFIRQYPQDLVNACLVDDMPDIQVNSSLSFTPPRRDLL